MALSATAAQILDYLDALCEQDWKAKLGVDEIAERLALTRHEAKLILAEVRVAYALDSEESADGNITVRLTASSKLALDEQRANHSNELLRRALLQCLGEEYDHDSSSTFDSRALCEKVGAAHNRVWRVAHL